MESKKNRMSVVLAGLLALAVAAVLSPGSSGTGGGARVAHAAPILSLDAGCTPGAIRPHELALVTCWTSVTNSGDETATEPHLQLAFTPEFNIAMYLIIDRVVNGEPVPVIPYQTTFPLPDIAPGETMEASSRAIVRAAWEEPHGGRIDLVHEAEVVDSALQSFDVTAGAEHPPANLAVSKTLSPPDQQAGTAAYDLLVSNVGDTTMTGVTVQDKPSSDIVLVSADPPVTSVGDVTGVLTWEMVSLAPGEELHIQATFAPADVCAHWPTNAMVVTAEADGTTEDYAAFSSAGIIGECLPGQTPTPSPVPPTTGPILLALGDSVMAGCCHDPNEGVAALFNAYLSERHDEEVTLVNLAHGVGWTAESFINQAARWPSGRTGTQLEEAVAVLGDAEGNGATVRAITLDIGGNDFLRLEDPDTRQTCYVTASEACELLFAEELVTYRGYLGTILGSLVWAKDIDTPILFMNYYNPFDTGEDTVLIQTVETAITQINAVIAEAAEAHGAYLVDIHPLFAGQAATLMEGVDPTPAGHQVLADAFAAAYEAYLRSQIEVAPTATAPPSPPAAATVEPPIVLPETGTGVGGAPTAFLPLASAAALAGTTLVLALALRRRAM